jgi:hypothetical protein
MYSSRSGKKGLRTFIENTTISSSQCGTSDLLFIFTFHNANTRLFSIHPDASGHPHVIMAHERFIEWVNTHEGVEWVPIYKMARTFREMYPTKEDWLEAEEARGTTV